MKRANRRAPQGMGKIQNIPQYNIDVQPVYSDRQSGNPCTTECRSRRYTNGVPGPWSGTYPAGKDCSDCCNGVARQGGSRLPQNAQRVCQVGSFNTANELASRQSKGVAQGVGKITTLPRLGIQVQGVNERPGLGPCTTMCRSRRYTDGVAGPWSGAYPAARQCEDCCGGGARLSQGAQQVCQKGSHNVSVAMAPGMKVKNSQNDNSRNTCAPGSTGRNCGFRCDCTEGIRAGRSMWCAHARGRTCVECCNGQIYPRGRKGMNDSSTGDYQIGNSAIDRNFSGGGNQNAIWSGSQSNVGPQDRIFAGNYASGMQGNCEDGYIELPNGGCIEEGLGDPSREQGCPRGQYRDRFGKCRSMQPGTYNAKTKRPPINPFAPTTLPYDPMGAKQIANPGCNPPCGKNEFCQGGQCYSGQPSARQQFISRRRR